MASASQAFIGMHLIGLRGLDGKWTVMGSQPALTEAQMSAVDPLKNSLVLIYHDYAPWGGEYERDGEPALRDSFTAELKPTGRGFDLTLASTDGDVAWFTDQGTAPHMPPVEAITPWADAHDIDPWALAMSIATWGTQAQPWLDDAQEATGPVIDLMRRAIAARVVDTLGTPI